MTRAADPLGTPLNLRLTDLLDPAVSLATLIGSGEFVEMPPSVAEPSEMLLTVALPVFCRVNSTVTEPFLPRESVAPLIRIGQTVTETLFWSKAP